MDILRREGAYSAQPCNSVPVMWNGKKQKEKTLNNWKKVNQFTLFFVSDDRQATSNTKIKTVLDIFLIFKHKGEG